MPSDFSSADTSSACEHAWCSTPHGATVHPDDEDHRSPGVLVHGVIRSRGIAHRTALEVGMLRRRHDGDEWLVIEDGERVHLEVTIETARRIVQAIAADATLRTQLARAPDARIHGD